MVRTLRAAEKSAEQMFRFLTAGESHGPGLTAIVEGIPAGMAFRRHLLTSSCGVARVAMGAAGA